MTLDHTLPPVPPPMSAEAVCRLADAELSLPARLGHVALLLAALMMTVVVASLWLTEPALPARTHAGFAVLVAIGLAWIGYAAWVLAERRPLLARHRIVAGLMAVAFTGLFFAAALAAVAAGGGAAARAAAGTGLVMLAAAIALLVRARRAFTQLSERRAALERSSPGRPAV
jgi:hypothetical protein